MQQEKVAISKSILEYLNSASRNKIIFFRDNQVGVEPVNIGKLIAKKLNTLPANNRFSLNAKHAIDKIFSFCSIEHEKYGKLIAISNLGILFEPDLKIDIGNLFDRHSSSNALFIRWAGEIKNKNLFFLSQQNGIKVELKNISHIII